MDDLDAAQTYSEILATGKFVSARLVRVLRVVVTYSAQYTTDSKETLENIKKTDHGFVLK
jgi:hypothetical protein